MLPLDTENTILPDQMMPVQFSGLLQKRRRFSGERLALAILEQAIGDLRQYRNARMRRRQRLYADAFRWIYSDDRNYPFSFINVCDVLKVSSQALRTTLAAEARAAVIPPETQVAA